MSLLLAKLIWFLGAATWFIIRYSHNRRSRHTPKASRHHHTRERWLMSISSTGLGILALGSGAGVSPAQLDRRAGGTHRLRHIVLSAHWPGRGDHAREIR